MLTFGDSGLGDVDADLSVGEGVEELSEAATWVNVHLMVVDGFLLGEV